ncbi:MAG: hypothetical protein HQM14_05375 [SAR324 cluster bacterium]|nr:hypothetical protein [SAR324 cluster bacterium]
MKVESHIHKRLVNFRLFGFLSIFLFPGLLFAEQENPPPKTDPSASVLPESNYQDSLEEYFSCLNDCSKYSSFDQSFKCLNNCSYPRTKLKREPPKRFIDEGLADHENVESKFRDITLERLECYGTTKSIHLRLRSCRKEYTLELMRLAKQINRAIRTTRNFKLKHGHRELGSFVICVQNCPIELAKCRGYTSLGRYMLTEDSLDDLNTSLGSIDDLKEIDIKVIIRKIATLEDQIFSQDELTMAVQSKLGQTDTDKYIELILEHAKVSCRKTEVECLERCFESYYL